MTDTINDKPKTVALYGAEYVFNVEMVNEAVSKWKASLVGAATTVANADNLFGKAALVALLTATITPANLARAAYAAFAPKSAKGKAASPKLQGDIVLSCSSLRTAKGGDNARKALDALFAIHATMNGTTDKEGANIMVPAVLAFIDGSKGAASSPRKLQEILDKAASVEAVRLGLNVTEETKQDDSDDSDDSDDKPTATLTSDAILTLAGLIESSDDETALAVADAIAVLMEAVNGRYAVNDEGEGEKLAA